MVKLSQYTKSKLYPTKKAEPIEKCIELFQDKTERKPRDKK
jgi:hypothetical protein